MASFLSTRAKKKSRASGFFFLYSSLFSFHSSLFSNLSPRDFSREEIREKREKRKECIFSLWGKAILIKRCQSAFPGKGAEVNLYRIILKVGIEKYQKT